MNENTDKDPETSNNRSRVAAYIVSGLCLITISTINLFWVDIGIGWELGEILFIFMGAIMIIKGCAFMRKNDE
jgi:sulfite exporter TauE/SafE